MTTAEARAYIDGFTDGGIFFAASFDTHEKRKNVFAEIKRKLRRAQEVTKDKYLPGSCAHCGEFHSHVCDAMKAALALDGE